MELWIAIALGAMIGGALTSAAWVHKHKTNWDADEATVNERVRALAKSFTGKTPDNTEEALDDLAIGVAEMRSDASRLLQRMSEMSRRIHQLERGDADQQEVLSATRRTLQTHLSRLSAERDGLITRIDRMTSFASGGLEYSEPMPSLLTTELEDQPTDPPDLPFDYRGGGANRGRA